MGIHSPSLMLCFGARQLSREGERIKQHRLDHARETRRYLVSDDPQTPEASASVRRLEYRAGDGVRIRLLLFHLVLHGAKWLNLKLSCTRSFRLF
jgi:hypothetical protein